jgi:phosphate transport system substrate-binding protein
MDLLLGQLIYTSFPGIGYKTLASEQVPQGIQQAFIERVVVQIWDAYNRPSSEYRSAYLLQVTPEDSLFGWLYNDGVDDLGRRHVPYFICYYLASPLSAFQLENIFTCLYKGPVELIDRDHLYPTLKSLILPDLWRYQGARPGVEIPWEIRKRSHIALKQGKLLNLFIPFNEQDIVIKLKEEVQQEQVAAEKDTRHDSLLVYRKNILLLGTVIGAVTSTVLAVSIYGLSKAIIFAPTKFNVISSKKHHIFYKTLAEVPDVPHGLFNYGGSTTLFKIVGSELTQAQPQFQLRLVEPIEGEPDSSTDNMLLAGELSFAVSSRPIKYTELLEAKERGFNLEQIPVAVDGIAVYVNPQVSITGLSLLQLRDIFSGKITNWKEVGGPDIQITPFSSIQQSSITQDILNEKVLSPENFGLTVQKVKNPTESIHKVAQTPGGIGYASVSEIVGHKGVYPLRLSKEAGQAFVSPCVGNKEIAANKTALANNLYPLSKKFFVIIKQDGSIDESAGIAFVNLLLTDEGQQLVTQTGFVPIR